jgi:hypothetical protein
MSVLIKSGRVVTAADDYVADVFIEEPSRSAPTPTSSSSTRTSA